MVIFGNGFKDSFYKQYLRSRNLCIFKVDICYLAYVLYLVGIYIYIYNYIFA